MYDITMQEDMPSKTETGIYQHNATPTKITHERHTKNKKNMSFTFILFSVCNEYQRKNAAA